MGCNGKCYLAKELSKTSDENSGKQNQPSTVKIMDVLPMSESQTLTFAVFAFNQNERIQVPYQNNYHFYFAESAEKPPQRFL